MLTQRIVEVATRLFCESGFELTSVDQIVAEAQISKQTFYARYPSKESLFAAVIRHGTDEVLKSVSDEHDLDRPVDLVLIDVGLRMLRRGLLRKGLLLQRLIYSDAQRFPQLAAAYRDNAFAMSRTFIADIIAKAMEKEQSKAGDAQFMSEQFLYSVVDGPLYAFMLGEKEPVSDEDLERRVRAAVHLFLDGCLPQRSKQGIDDQGAPCLSRRKQPDGSG